MPVQIEIDKLRTLKFDLAAVRDLEAQMDGKPLGAIIADITRLGVNAIVLALWAGLKHEDKSITVNLVTKITDTYLKAGRAENDTRSRLRVLGEAINNALDETGLFGGDDEGNAQPEPAAS